MKKRLFPILISLLMVFAMMPMTAGTAFATDPVQVGCDNFKCWIEQDKGTAVIGGRAAGNEDAEISIPASVTYEGKSYTVTLIDTGAFENDTLIKSLTVADGITEIGQTAFKGCSNLAEIYLPDSVTRIHKSSFYGTAYYNNEDNWEDGVLYIGKCLSAGEKVNGECVIKEGTKEITAEAFENNNGLTAVTIPASVDIIRGSAFLDCRSLASVNIDEDSSLTHIEQGVFSNCGSLTSFKIPDSVNRIESLTFAGTGLESIVLPEGLESIEGQLFENCSSLSEVTIPSTVTEISGSAFANCDALETIHFGGSPSQWAAITGSGKPADELVKDYGKEDVETTLKLSVYDAANNTWLDADDPAYVTSATINGTDTRTAQLPDGIKATITITPANGYMVSNVSVNESHNPSSIVQDFQSWTDQETGVHTISFTPPKGGSYAFSVSLHEAVRVTYDLNGGTVGEDWLGNTRIISKGSVETGIGYEFEKITPPEGKVLSAVEITTDSGTFTIKAADLNNTAHSYDSDVTFKCIWESDQPEPATQTITASNITKTYGNAAFSLGAKTSGDGALTYKSSNTKVVTVSNDGKVAIKGAGTAKITISAAATANYAAASKTITVTVNKANNPLAMKPKTATVKYKSLKKKAQPLAVTKVITFTKQLKDKKTYTLSAAKKGKKSFKKYFTVNKTTGKVTVKKGLKKGTYKVTVKVRAAGNTNYKPSTLKTVTFTIKVK